MPAKQGKMHARHLMYRYPQYGCRSDLPIKLFSFCSQTVYCWGSQCFLMLSWCDLDMCDLFFFFWKLIASHGSKPCKKKTKEHILTSRTRFHSAMHRSNFHLIPHLVSIYCDKFKAYLNHIAEIKYNIFNHQTMDSSWTDED